MRKFTEELTNQEPTRELQPDEYFHESDYLIYCAKCHTPRQGRYTLQGRVFMPPIRCKCQQELYDQEETRRKLLEKQAEIEQMKASGLQDKALYDYTFDKDNGITPEMAYAHKYVENWEDMKARSSGLLLWGNVGTGKSFFDSGTVCPHPDQQPQHPAGQCLCQSAGSEKNTAVMNPVPTISKNVTALLPLFSGGDTAISLSRHGRKYHCTDHSKQYQFKEL